MFPSFREINCHLPNQRAGVDAGFGLLLAFKSHWPGTTQHGR
jgi:hypothetical protein